MHDDRNQHGPNRDSERTLGTLASRRDVLATVGTGAVASGIGLGASSVTGQAADETGVDTPWLDVEGNKVYDPLGNEVILRGLNIPDPKRLDHTVPARGKNWDHMIDLATNRDRGWHANVLRIPVHPGDIAEEPPVPVADENVHRPPTFDRGQLLDYCENYLDDVVDYCRQKNVYCIVDYHRHWGEGDLKWTNDDLDSEVRMFWETVAPRYGGEPHVIFEVYNEPTLPGLYIDEWYTPKYAGLWRMWKQTAQPWVDIIRKHAPRNLIVVGSPGWSAMPEGAQIEEFDGGNLLYAYHIYAGHNIRSDEGFDSRQTSGGEVREEGTNSVWEDVPLFMTEFGWEPGSGRWIGGTTEGFGRAVTEWAQERPIHWAAWCFDSTWLPSMWDRSFVDADQADSVGDPYSGEIPELCSDPPCEWELLGRDKGAFEEYSGEYLRQTLEESADADAPTVDHDETPPAVPTDVSTSGVDASSASLSSSEVTETGLTDLSHYVVTVEGEDWLETDSTSAAVEDLLAGRTQTLGVKAVDEYGNVGDPATVDVTTDDASGGDPGQPAGLTLSDRTHTSVTLSWDAPADTDAARYVVYRAGSEVARLRSDRTTYRIDGLEFDGQYDVAVSTVDRTGTESEPLSAVVEPRPAHATEDDLLVNDFEGSEPLTNNSLGNWVGGGIADGVSDGVAQWSWDGTIYYGTAIDTDVSDMPQLKVKARGEAGYELSFLSFEVDSDDGEYPVGDYTDDRIGQEWSVVTLDFEEIGIGLPDPGQLQFNAPWGTQAALEVGEIWFAAPDDPADGIEVGGSQPEPEPPASPDDQWTNSVTATSIELGWSPVATAEEYELALDGGEPVTTADTTYAFTGLSPDTEYAVAIRSVNDAGRSPAVERTVTTAEEGESPCEDSVTVGDRTVCDTDGDGLYDDLDGNGDLTHADVQEFFSVQHRPTWKQPDRFDFNGNDVVGHGDVIALFEDVATNPL